jgi:hypothetical protein
MTTKKFPKRSKPEFPLCFKYLNGAQGNYEIEQALSKAENKGLEKGKLVRKFEQKNIREQRIQGERSIKRAEINILEESNQKQKERIAQLEKELKTTQKENENLKMHIACSGRLAIALRERLSK